MKRIVRRLLWDKKESLPLMLAATGFTLGLFLLFGAIRFGGELVHMLKPRGSDTTRRFIVINKQVNLTHTLGFGTSAFSQEELQQLRQQEFVKDVGPIVTTNFAVAGAAHLGLAGLQSELFFEAVDDRFLDTQPTGWHWQEGELQIPAILARDFLALYNFGYASAKGLPQLTEETVGVLQARVVCTGDDTQQVFTGRIVGFSDRFATILVPMAFMEWANAEIGRKPAPPVARAILEIEPGQEEAVQAFLDGQSYETNREKLPLTRVAGALKIVLIVISLLGGVLILVSGLSLVLFIQLLMSRARPHLRLLHQLGFDDSFLARTYVVVILPILCGCFVLAGVGVWGLGFLLKPALSKFGFAMTPHLATLTVILLGLGFVGVVALFHGFIKRTIRCIQ